MNVALITMHTPTKLLLHVSLYFIPYVSLIIVLYIMELSFPQKVPRSWKHLSVIQAACFCVMDSREAFTASCRKLGFLTFIKESSGSICIIRGSWQDKAYSCWEAWRHIPSVQPPQAADQECDRYRFPSWCTIPSPSHLSYCLHEEKLVHWRHLCPRSELSIN